MSDTPNPTAPLPAPAQALVTIEKSMQEAAIEHKALAPVSQPDGSFDTFMSNVFGRNWRTTLLGVVTTACGIAVVIPGMPLPVVAVCSAVLPIASGAGLMVAKDAAVSGIKPKN